MGEELQTEPGHTVKPLTHSINNFSWRQFVFVCIFPANSPYRDRMTAGAGLPCTRRTIKKDVVSKKKKKELFSFKVKWEQKTRRPSRTLPCIGSLQSTLSAFKTAKLTHTFCHRMQFGLPTNTNVTVWEFCPQAEMKEAYLETCAFKFALTIKDQLAGFIQAFLSLDTLRRCEDP